MIYPIFTNILAPLSGYTDLPFRDSCRRYGCSHAFTPLIDAKSVVYQNHRNKMSLVRGKNEKWLGLQLLGREPEFLSKAIEILQEQGYSYDVIDLNLGCPVPKVVKRGCGAMLSNEPKLAAECLKAMKKVSAVPITAKIRIQSEEDSSKTIEFAKILHDTGIEALTIHGRIREKKYSGTVFSDIIRAVNEALPIQVIANGGVFDIDSASELRKKSGCSEVMIARGAIGNPWLFRLLNGGKPPTHEEVCDELERHILQMVNFYDEDIAMRHGRKYVSAYLGGRGYQREVRASVTQMTLITDFLDILKIIRKNGPTTGFYNAMKAFESP